VKKREAKIKASDTIVHNLWLNYLIENIVFVLPVEMFNNSQPVSWKHTKISSVFVQTKHGEKVWFYRGLSGLINNSSHNSQISIFYSTCSTRLRPFLSSEEICRVIEVAQVVGSSHGERNQLNSVECSSLKKLARVTLLIDMKQFT
jgi:hypothetical protein